MMPRFAGLVLCPAALLGALLIPALAGAQEQAPVDSIFAQWDRPDSPGCALGVYRDGAVVYARGYGMADLEHGVPITPHTVFDIGSTSKQFTAASILLLAQQGRLTLDDDVRRHIPELPVYSRPITIRQLLHHTSGLRDYINLLSLAGESTDDVTTPAEALAILVRQKQLNFEPGAEHLYSNSGYFLLSIIVERVSGSSLREFARAQIFAPLGMARTHYLGSYADIVPDRAIGYSPGENGLRSDVPRWLQLGDGAVWTTVEELLRWDENFYEPKVGGAAMLAELQTPGRLADGTPLSYALGLMIGDYRGQRLVSHGGAWGGYRADLLRFPDQHFSVATLCNLETANPSQLARRVADVYLADVLAPAPGAAAAAETQAQNQAQTAPGAATAPISVPERTLRELVGSYRHPETRALRTIELEDGRLYLTTLGRYELRPRSATEFDLVGAPVRVSLVFEPPAGTAPGRMRWTVAGDTPVLLDRLDPVTLDAADLAGYAGSFHSGELQTTYTVEAGAGALVLHTRAATPITLRPITRDEFAAESMILRFQRGGGGQVTGYALDVGRVRDLRFERTGP